MRISDWSSDVCSSDLVLVNDAPKYKSPRILSFSSHDLPIDLPQIERFRGRDVDREKTIPELVTIGHDPATPEKLRNKIRANFHFRMVEVAMMLLLPLAALAFAIPPKRSTRSEEHPSELQSLMRTS